MEEAAANARYDALHEEKPYHNGTFEHWSKTRDEDHPYQYREGVTIYVADRDDQPDATFLSPPDDEWHDDESEVGDDGDTP